MFKRCTEIDATYVQAHLELFRLNRESQAALILSDAIKANPDNVELRLAFGHWLLNNGNAQHKHSHKHTCTRNYIALGNYLITLLQARLTKIESTMFMFS